MNKKNILLGLSVLALSTALVACSDETNGTDKTEETKNEQVNIEERFEDKKEINIEQNELYVDNVEILKDESANGFYITPLSYTTFTKFETDTRTFEAQDGNVFVFLDIQIENKDTGLKDLAYLLSANVQLTLDDGMVLTNERESSFQYQRLLQLKSLTPADTLAKDEKGHFYYMFELKESVLDNNLTLQLVSPENGKTLDMAKIIKK